MSRRSRSAIVCAADEKFFGFAKGLILSIRAHFGTRFDIHFIDLGLSSRSMDWLESQDAAVTCFDFRSVISMKRNPTLPDYIGAMICRPLLPSVLPGYETYIWMDSDTWIQCLQSVIAFEAAARYGGKKFTISSTDPWVYGLNDVQRTREAHAGPRSPPSTRAPEAEVRHDAPYASSPTPGLSREYAPLTPATTRGHSACAAVPPRRHRSPSRPRVTHPDRRLNDPRGAPARWQMRRLPLSGAHEAGTWANTQRTPIEIPIPKFLSRLQAIRIGRAPRKCMFWPSSRRGACRGRLCL